MLEVDVNKLEETWQQQKKFLKDGLISGDIWDRNTGLPVASYNTNPEATALFNQLTAELIETLDGSGVPSLNKYYLLNLQEDKMFLLIRHGDDLLQGMLLNPLRVNIGILFTVAIPKALASVEAART